MLASVTIWLATMPAASKIPTAPAKPSLFPIRLSLIMATTPNSLKQISSDTEVEKQPARADSRQTGSLARTG
jgi:hypothetical protein